MFGEVAKKDEPKPQPPAIKDANINALFGTGPVQKPDVPNTKSPVAPKKDLNFNFEDAWRAEGPSSSSSPNVPPPKVQPVQPIPSVQSKNPMMNNVPKPPEPIK